MSPPSYATMLVEWSVFAGKWTMGIISVLALLLYSNQDRLLYIPNPPGFPQKPTDNTSPFRSPGEWTVKGKRSHGTDSIPFEEEHLLTSDGKLIHTWLMLQKNSNNVPTLIYFHGNAGNMGLRLKNAAMMYALCGINILMMDYRGFGSSTGVPNEVGLNIDAVTVMEYARNHLKLRNSHLIAFGRSLGGAVAISLADAYPDIIQGVIIENTFLSVGAMVDVLMPFLTPIKSLVLCIGWHSDVKIANLKQPILLISGDCDELVPPSHMRKLRECATKSRNLDFYSVFGGGHNDTFDRAGADYYLRLLSFLKKSFPDFQNDWEIEKEKKVEYEGISYVNNNDIVNDNNNNQNNQNDENNNNNSNEKDEVCRNPDLCFDNAELIDDELDGDASISLPTMQKNFIVR